MKNLSFFIMIFPFLFSCKKSVLTNIGNHLDTNHVTTISLSDFTKFKWDTVWIISPREANIYLSLMREHGLDVEKVENPLNTKYGVSREFADIAIFVQNRKIIHYDYSPFTGSSIDKMNKLLFQYPSDLKHRIMILSKDKAIFHVDRYGTALKYYELSLLNDN